MSVVISKTHTLHNKKHRTDVCDAQQNPNVHNFYSRVLQGFRAIPWALHAVLLAAHKHTWPTWRGVSVHCQQFLFVLCLQCKSSNGSALRMAVSHCERCTFSKVPHRAKSLTDIPSVALRAVIPETLFVAGFPPVAALLLVLSLLLLALSVADPPAKQIQPKLMTHAIKVQRPNLAMLWERQEHKTPVLMSATKWIDCYIHIDSTKTRWENVFHAFICVS